jgi:iron complex outermembrane receptor protein
MFASSAFPGAHLPGVSRVLATLALFSALFGPGQLTAQTPGAGGSTGSTGGIAGEVRSSTGAPIEGVVVRVEGLPQRAVTDRSGRFRVGGVPAGPQVVFVEHLGYGRGSESVTVPSGASVQVNFVLEATAIGLEGVIVTAQGRSQSLLNVPVALSALEGSFLQNLGLQEFDQLSEYVPGLQVQLQSPNNPGFVVRGITSDSGDSRIEPRVSVFQDGVSISKSRGSVVELFDMERVEVLKGPQGTLFGRGAQIGAIHLIQNKAANRSESQVTLGGGAYADLYAEAMGNTPLVEDRLFGRAAAIYQRRDGFIENVSGGTLNGKETLALRASLRWEPDQDTGIDLIGNFQRDTPPGTSFKSAAFAPRGGDTNFATAADLERGEDLYIDRTVWGLTLLGERRLSPTLRLSSITAYREFDSDESFDADGTVAPVLWFAEEARGTQFSQELRLAFEGAGRISGFTGASVFRESGSQRVPWETDERSLFALFSPFLAPFGVPTLPLVNPDGTPNLSVTTNPLTGQPLKTFHSEAYENFGSLSAVEVFADATFQATERLAITAGIRGTYEDVTGEYEVENSETPGTLGFILGVAPNNLFAPTDGRRSASETFTSAVGRLVAQYQPSETMNLFGSVSRGRRPNVINVTASAVNVLNNELVLSYDAGIRTLLADGRLQFDANAFYYDYDNFQTSVAEVTEDGLRIEVRDSGSATAYGLETGIRAELSPGFSLFANYGWISASFDDVDSDGTPQELAGNRFRLTPDHSASAGFEVSGNLGSLGRGYLRPNVSYKSQVFFEEENQPGIEQDGYALVNLRAGLVLPGGRWEVSAFVNNLLDESYLIDAGNTGGAFGIPTFIAGPPRHLGVRLSARLGDHPAVRGLR